MTSDSTSIQKCNFQSEYRHNVNISGYVRHPIPALTSWQLETDQKKKKAGTPFPRSVCLNMENSWYSLIKVSYSSLVTQNRNVTLNDKVWRNNRFFFFGLRIRSNVLLGCEKFHIATEVFRLSFSVVHCTESGRHRRISAAVRDTIPQPSMVQHYRFACTGDFVTIIRVTTSKTMIPLGMWQV